MDGREHTKYAYSLRQALEDDIVEGRLRPGTKLDELSLAERFKVSRTPIREALQQLGAVGLVEIRPRRSAIVSAPSIRNVIEMFETMAEIEAVCGRLAARRHSPEDLVAIRRANAACAAAAEAGDQNAYYEENVEFHSAIYRASHNGFLADQAVLLHRRLAPLRRLQLRSRNRMAFSLAEHNLIVEALEAGDGDLVANRLREHIVIQGERFNDVVATLSAFDIKA